MRRIIERTVTVVTTTTWTISWQDVPPPHSSSEVDPAPETASDTDILSAPITPEPSVVIETKEADSESAEKSAQSKLSSTVIHSHPSKPERK